MATDFTNNNTTISASGGLQPGTRNTPLDVRTRVNLKADIDSIPNPFVGMKILVLQDETNDNQMTEYVVVSLKANNLGIADSKVDEVVLAKDFLGINSSASGEGMSSEQVQQLNTAYTHSQSTHVQQSDIPTKVSQLENDSNFISSIPSEYITETELNTALANKANKSEIPSLNGYATESFVTNKIAEASLSGGEVDLSGYATKDELKTKANVNHTHTMSNITDLVIPDVDKAYVDTQLNTKANKSDIPSLDGYALKTDIPTVPTKVSDLTNDSGYITEVPSEYVTETELESKGYLTEHQDISGKADKSEIPTKTSQLTNNSGFLTSIPSEYITESELNAKGYLTSVPSEYITETELNSKGYLTQHQDLSNYALKTEIPSVPTKTSQLTNDSGYVTNAGVDEKVANAFTNEIPELNILSLVLGNYQIKYNSTDDTLDFLYNGVIDEPDTTDTYVTEGLSMYIDATRGSISDITGNYTITNHGVTHTSDNNYLNFVASESDYIDTNLVPNLSTWSAEIYFYYTAELGADTQVILGWGVSGSKLRIGYSDDAGALVVQSNNDANLTIANVSDIVSPLHHLIVTMNNGALTSYFDGVKTVLCESGSTQTSHTGTLKIGCKYNGTQHFADINLRMFRFYDGKALTDEEALQNYNYEINRG